MATDSFSTIKLTNLLGVRYLYILYAKEVTYFLGDFQREKKMIKERMNLGPDFRHLLFKVSN